MTISLDLGEISILFLLKLENQNVMSHFFFKSINLWNNIPLNIKNFINLSVFKNKVRAFLLDNMAV